MLPESNMLSLKEGINACDTNKIIASLIKLRKSSTVGSIDRKTFELLVELIKMPNAKILSYTLSLLANCCVNNTYRTIFHEAGGVTHLILIIETIENDSIICRACRLVGNLSSNRDVAKELCEKNIGLALASVLEKTENLSLETVAMTFRATKKLWFTNGFKWKKLPDNLVQLIIQCVNSKDDSLVKLTLDVLSLFTNYKNIQENGKFPVSKELFLKLIDLTKKSDFTSQAIICLSNMICYQPACIWGYLEGSEIAEIFIDYFQKSEHIERGIYKAFHKLCTEGAVRNKVRLSGLLNKLIDKSNESNVKKIIAIFYLFQHDEVTMMMCSQNSKFISILIDNISLPESIQLLTVLSRVTPPVKELVQNNNLDIIINNKKCTGVLRNITRNHEFLKPILLSGRVWEIDKAGCPMDDLGSPALTEYLLIELLNTNERKTKEDVSLAVPFLVKPRNFELLFKLLAHYQVMTNILQVFQENSTEERVLASIVRLINIFRYNYYKPVSFFQDFAGGESECEDREFQNSDLNGSRTTSMDSTPNKSDTTKNGETHHTLVTFELDNGKCVDVNKVLLCKNSPVFNSMLNGYFLEAKQEKVRLHMCTEEGLLHLVRLLKEDVDLSNIETEVYLELLSLTDRFLLTGLNTALTKSLRVDEQSCSLIYKWYHTAGYTKNTAFIRQKVFEFIFSSSKNLLSAMKNEYSRTLVSDISQYLSNSLIDLL